MAKRKSSKYLGKWIVLDEDKFIGAGNAPRPIVAKARKEEVKVPSVKFIEDDSDIYLYYLHWR